MKKTLISLALVAGISFYACEKENDDTNNDDNSNDENTTELTTTSTEDNNTADALFNDVFQTSTGVISAAEQEKGVNKNGPGEGLMQQDSCASISISLSADSSHIDTIIVDYGDNSSCLTDGRVRQGKLNIYLDGKFRTSGTTATVVLEDYSIDGYQIEGSKSITNNGFTMGQSFTYSVEVSNASITTPEGDVISWESSRTQTLDISTSQLSIDGTMSGTDREGTNYDLEIIESIILKHDCRYITEGVFEITPEGKTTRTVDYGDGTCDSLATVSAGQYEMEIVLP